LALQILLQMIYCISSRIGVHSIIVIWVDDIITSDYSLIIINYFKVQFSSHYDFKITDLGELRYVLRTIFKYVQANYFIYLSQELYFQ